MAMFLAYVELDLVGCTRTYRHPCSCIVADGPPYARAPLEPRLWSIGRCRANDRGEVCGDCVEW
jgi:hypothetical protein